MSTYRWSRGTGEAVQTWGSLGKGGTGSGGCGWKDLSPGARGEGGTWQSPQPLCPWQHGPKELTSSPFSPGGPT